MLSSKDYLRILEKWVGFAKKHFYIPPGRPDLLCYGTGYDSWGVQTQQKAFSAFAVLAADPGTEEKNAGMGRDELLEYAVRMLRFNLESHKTGTYTCTNGTKWGNTWISVLGIERMMPGIEALGNLLPEKERESLKRVMLSEADHLLDMIQVKAGTVENNQPESNLWNGSHLYRTAIMYPDTPRAEDYIKKGTSFIINGISVASDAKSKDMVNGKPVSGWYIGDNFFETFALNHHKYLNIGYMYICLSQVAILYFTCRIRNLPVPEALLRHLPELWELLKLCTFPDGRLCRIGGDTRIRYSYCQDYALPAWLMIYDLYGDKICETLEEGWYETVRKEVTFNGDGSFLSARCSGIERISSLYYTRLESDRAATFAMAAYWKRTLKTETGVKFTVKEEIPARTWHDNYHGACMSRGKKRLASWCWAAAEAPQGLCVPTERSDMAEWRNNCAGMILGQGRVNRQRIICHREHVFEGGFSTVGKTEIFSGGFFEGQSDEIAGNTHLLFTALPDDTTVIVMQKCLSSMRRVYLNEAKGLFYNIPNDIFNDSVRSYMSTNGRIDIKGGNEGRKEVIEIVSPWLNVDDCIGFIGVYGAESFSICRPPVRQAGLILSQYEREVISTGLWIDELCFPFIKGPFSADAGSSLFDIGCIILAGSDAEMTSDYWKKKKARRIRMQNPDVRAMAVEALNGKDYLQIVNFGESGESLVIPIDSHRKAVSVHGKAATQIKEDRIATYLEPGDMQLFEISKKNAGT